MRLVVTHIARNIFSPRDPVLITVTLFNKNGEKVMDFVYPAKLFEGDIEMEQELHFIPAHIS